MKRTALKPRNSPLRRVSTKRAKLLRAYTAIRKDFLSRRWLCEPCHFNGRYGIFSTEVHHRRGRIGSMLVNEAYFLPVCRECHRWIHDHPSEARMKGYLVSSNHLASVHALPLGQPSE